MKIFSYHVNKSSGVGGVESLIRSFYTITEDIEEIELVELYHDISGHEINVKNSKLIKLKEFFIKDSLINRFSRKLSLMLYFLLKNVRDSVIIIYHPSDLIFFPRYILRNNKVIIVQTNRFDIVLNKLSHYTLLRVMDLIKLFTVYTEMDKNKFQNIYPEFPSHKIKVIPRACRISVSNIKKKNNKKLVTICRFNERQKNISGMVEVVEKLPSSYELYIYGSGPENEVNKIKKMINEKSNIHFMGPAINIQEVLNDKSIFLMTSHYEGFGQTLIEARSQGLPIVAYDTFDALSWIVDDSNGRIINYQDVDQFASEIINISTNDKFYSDLSENSLSRANETEASRINDIWLSTFIHLK